MQDLLNINLFHEKFTDIQVHLVLDLKCLTAQKENVHSVLGEKQVTF